MDMDGVLVHEEHAIPGADRIPRRGCTSAGIPFLVLTNNSTYMPPRPGCAPAASASRSPRRRSSPPRTPPQGSSRQRPASGFRSAKRADDSAAPGGLHPDPAQPRLRRPGGRTATTASSASRTAIGSSSAAAPHRYESRPHRPVAGGAAAGRPAPSARCRPRPVSPLTSSASRTCRPCARAGPTDAHSKVAAIVGDRMDTDVVAGPRRRAFESDPRAQRRHDARGGGTASLPAFADRRLGRRPRRPARLSLSPARAARAAG